MHVDVELDALASAVAAADRVAAAACDAIAARGRFIVAFSGGSTPWKMFERLAQHELDWAHFHVFQVDERAVPDGNDRNLTHLRQKFLSLVPIPDEHIHPMDVRSPLNEGAERYEDDLLMLNGGPIVFDLVHLGLGSDGHTASLVPGDPVLDVKDRDVATTRAYQGCRRMTLTYPALNRSRCIVWLVSGANKQRALKLLLAQDKSIPAARVAQDRAKVIADRAAAGG